MQALTPAAASPPRVVQARPHSAATCARSRCPKIAPRCVLAQPRLRARRSAHSLQHARRAGGCGLVQKLHPPRPRAAPQRAHAGRGDHAPHDSCTTALTHLRSPTLPPLFSLPPPLHLSPSRTLIYCHFQAHGSLCALTFYSLHRQLLNNLLHEFETRESDSTNHTRLCNHPSSSSLHQPALHGSTHGMQGEGEGGGQRHTARPSGGAGGTARRKAGGRVLSAARVHGATRHGLQAVRGVWQGAKGADACCGAPRVHSCAKSSSGDAMRCDARRGVWTARIHAMRKERRRAMQIISTMHATLAMTRSRRAEKPATSSCVHTVGGHDELAG